MEEVLLSFVIEAVAVLYTASRFRGTFEEIFKGLQILFCTLARRNHKGNSVGKYRRFLNKKKLSQDKIVVVTMYLSRTQKS